MRVLFAIIAGATLGLASATQAAVITWGSPLTADKNNAAQVVNSGTFVLATTTSSSVTVNTVPFTTGLPSYVPNENGFSLGYSGRPFTTAYQNILDGGVYKNGSAGSFDFNGLIVGRLYLVQAFVPYWNADYVTTIDGISMGNNQTTPKYIVGNFTANATTQSFAFQGVSGSYGLLGAVQVRDVTPVPEPASLGVLGLSGMLLARRRIR